MRAELEDRFEQVGDAQAIDDAGGHRLIPGGGNEALRRQVVHLVRGRLGHGALYRADVVDLPRLAFFKQREVGRNHIGDIKEVAGHVDVADFQLWRLRALFDATDLAGGTGDDEAVSLPGQMDDRVGCLRPEIDEAARVREVVGRCGRQKLPRRIG